MSKNLLNMKPKVNNKSKNAQSKERKSRNTKIKKNQSNNSTKNSWKKFNKMILLIKKKIKLNNKEF